MTNTSIVVILSMTLGACAASGQAAQPPAAQSAPPNHGIAHGAGPMNHGGAGQGMMGQGMMKDCPMKLEGVTVRMDEVDGGAALVFATQGDVAELRRRVAHMVEMHQKHDGRGCPMMHATAPSPSSEKPSQP